MQLYITGNMSSQACFREEAEVDPALTTHLGTSFRWRTAIRSVAFPQYHFSHLLNPVGSVVDPEPHWFGSPGSGSVSRMRIRIRIQEQKINKLKNKHKFEPFKKAFVPYLRRYVYDILPTQIIFSFEISTFCDGKTPWIRIRISIGIKS